MDVEVDGEPPELSSGFADAVEWFGNRYERCSQRAQTVKGWLPEGATHEPSAYMDQVLFERALALSRNAARKEILDQNPWDCEVMYQDSLWLLYTVRDDLEAPSNGYMEEDRSTIDTCTQLFHLWGVGLSSCRDYPYQAASPPLQGARRDAGSSSSQGRTS
ncbi:hypothetical protein PIIN_11452 [Serendipita indica DSM 11827]|uniref:ATG1-like MIT domain-containing protein n=1 Tax=Serendipita indica (strain DSM 11827) TaxID=1109443 RepID=G4U1N2_SERID|nr:hypothetical protein PIIN_11452 [Serendipita indica DSM 11827]